MAKSNEELKSLLMKVKESEKAGLKLNIQKAKIMMASCPITSWQIDGETLSDFNLWGFKITSNVDSSHTIKRHLFLGRKAMTNLDSILKIHYFSSKGLYSQSYGFSSSHLQM